METPISPSGELLHLLLDIGEQLIKSGAEVKRVEDTLTRMGKAYGAEKMNVFVITSSIVVTMACPDGQELTQTRRISGFVGTDFTRLERLNALSRRCCAHPLPIDELRGEIAALLPGTKQSIIVFGSVLAAGSFAVFFGGSLPDALLASLFAAVICFLQAKLAPLCPNRVVFNLLASLITGLLICLSSGFLPCIHTDKVMIGDIMLLIPGLAMTNAVRDVLVGDTISGVMRFLESLLWAIALACGFMIAIWMTGGRI